MTTRLVNAVALVVAAFGFYFAPAGHACGQDNPVVAEAKGPEIGDVRVRTLAAVNYAYVETETTFDQLGPSIGVAMPQLQKAVEDRKITVAGPFVLVYPEKSSHLTPDKPFKVQIGFFVAEGSSGAGEVKVRKTEPFKAATILYTGPVTGIGQCYQKLFPAIERMGLEPTGEEREFTLYFENVDSPNNVVLVQVGVKEGRRVERQGKSAAAPQSRSDETLPFRTKPPAGAGGFHACRRQLDGRDDEAILWPSQASGGPGAMVVLS